MRRRIRERANRIGSHRNRLPKNSCHQPARAFGPSHSARTDSRGVDSHLMESDAAPATPLSESRNARLFWWATGLVSIGLLLLVYQPALRGPLISDDYGYLTSPYTESLDLASLSRMFDPTGDARLYTGNYAPVHLLLHAVARTLFGRSWLGHHVVNVGLHALNALLLALLLQRSGASRSAALLGGAVFAFHPANVEAVGWMSQLKSTAALAFSLLGLLYFDRRPALAAACFGLGLLTKASAAFALPALAAFVWVGGIGAGDPRRWRWVGVWCGIFGLYTFPQFASFQHIGAVEVGAFADPLTHLRTVAAIGARYLLMAASSIGVSAFADPRPVESWWNGYWLAGLFVGIALASRTFWGLGARRVEAAWWVAAAAAFAPVSQVFPFLIPLADRYLYFILPGLIGGAIFCTDALLQRVGLRWRSGETALRRGAMLVVGIIAVSFGVYSHARAALWQDENLLLVDAALHYPDGGTAHYLRARRAARQGRFDEAVASLRLASDRGLDRFQTIQRDPAFAAMRSTAAFRSLIAELAGHWIARARVGPASTQPELLAVAQAYRARGEDCDAVRILEQALARPGPLRDVVEAEMAALREKSAGECADGTGGKEARHPGEDS